MELNVRPLDSFHVLAVEGEINLFNAPRLREKIHEMLTSGELDIALDFSGVPYIDSTGIGALIAANISAKNKGGRFALAAIPPEIEKIFRVTKVGDYFKIYPTLAAVAEAWD